VSASEKQEIIGVLRELGELTLLDEQNPQSFRVRAYENAVHGLEDVHTPISEMTESQLVKVSGVGKSTAKKIREYFETGKVEKLDQLRVKFPPAYVELSKIPGLGPKGLAKLRAQLGIENLADLRAALEAQTIRTLSGFGAKSEQKLAHAIERLGMTGKNRRAPIADAMAVATQVLGVLEAMPEVERAQYCGSLRRLRETIGDVDIVLASVDPAPVMARIPTLPIVSEVIGAGPTKTSFLTPSSARRRSTSQARRRTTSSCDNVRSSAAGPSTNTLCPRSNPVPSSHPRPRKPSTRRSGCRSSRPSCARTRARSRPPRTERCRQRWRRVRSSVTCTCIRPCPAMGAARWFKCSTPRARAAMSTSPLPSTPRTW
jgi:DNA polymerase/3'-5' exonuclease PolX